VRSLSGDALRRRWRAVFGRPAPQHLTVDLVRRMIANRIQEEAFGMLDRTSLKRWRPQGLVRFVFATRPDEGRSRSRNLDSRGRARDEALTKGVIINGLVMPNEDH